VGLYHRYTDDVIQRFRTLDDEGVSRVVFENLAQRHSVGIDVFFNHSFNKWWKGNISVNAYRSEVFGENIDPSFNVAFFSMFGRLSQTFSLLDNLDLQINYFYRAPMETIQGRMLSMQAMDVAVTHEFWDGNASLTLRVSDVFDTRFFRFRTEAQDFTVDTEWNRLTRRGLLTFTYKFNNYRERRTTRSGAGGDDFEGM
jgi:iron complex outermembrane receptor protein